MASPVSRFAILALTLTLSGGLPLAVAAQTATAPVVGRVRGEARRPYTDYTIQLRDTETGQVTQSIPVDTEGRFRFEGVTVDRRFILELYHPKEQQVLCTEGPFATSRPQGRSTSAVLEVVVDCGLAPAAWWILAASAGTVSAVSLLTVSASK